MLGGIRTMRSRSMDRTRLLRQARKVVLRGGAESAALADELRNLAYEYECEMESHKVRMLGLPLSTRMLETLVGGVVALGLVFYQAGQGGT